MHLLITVGAMQINLIIGLWVNEWVLIREGAIGSNKMSHSKLSVWGWCHHSAFVTQPNYHHLISYIYSARETSLRDFFGVIYSCLTFEQALESRVMLHFTPHIKTQSSHTLWTHTMHTHTQTQGRQTLTHTHTHTLAQSPDHRYCALHESLSTVRAVCNASWAEATPTHIQSHTSSSLLCLSLPLFS